MKRVLRHMMAPALMPALFFAVAFTPVHVFGCRGRGLMALTFAFVSGLAALTTTFLARNRHRRGDKTGIWWLITALILTIPVVAMIIMA